MPATMISSSLTPRLGDEVRTERVAQVVEADNAHTGRTTRPWNLRVTFVRSSGLPALRRVQEWLGHADAKTTQICTSCGDP